MSIVEAMPEGVPAFLRLRHGFTDKLSQFLSKGADFHWMVSENIFWNDGLLWFPCGFRFHLDLFGRECRCKFNAFLDPCAELFLGLDSTRFDKQPAFHGLAG